MGPAAAEVKLGQILMVGLVSEPPDTPDSVTYIATLLEHWHVSVSLLKDVGLWAGFISLLPPQFLKFAVECNGTGFIKYIKRARR